MARLSETVKSLFYVTLALMFAPMIYKNLKQTYRSILEPKAKIGVLPVRGIIIDVTPTIRHARALFKDTEIKGIILLMDSPGGTAGSSFALFEELKNLKAQYNKPVIASVENICTSGAYLTALSADTIVATPAALIGSIGVYFPLPQLKAFIEQFKIQYDVVKTGIYKTATDPFLTMSPEQRAMMQGLSDNTYIEFTNTVALQRPNLSLDKVSEWANGKIFIGRQAQKLGLIDEIGTISHAEMLIKKRAHIEGDVEWVKPQSPSLIARLFGADDDFDEDPFTADTHAATRTASFITNIYQQLASGMSSVPFLTSAQ